MYNASTKAARISNRELRRRAESAIAIGTKAYSILLTVLAQKGGEVVVTAGTIAQVGRTFNDLDFEVIPNKDIAGEFIVRLLDGKAGPEFATPQEFATTNQERTNTDARIAVIRDGRGGEVMDSDGCTGVDSVNSAGH